MVRPRAPERSALLSTRGEVRSGYELTAGPMKGAALNTAIGTPRSSDFQQSANVPPTRVIAEGSTVSKSLTNVCRCTIYAQQAGKSKKTECAVQRMPLLTGRESDTVNQSTDQ